MALTLRLDQDELQALERIKELEQEKTASAAIKKLINKYEKLRTNYQQAKQENQELQEQLTDLQSTTRDYMTAKHRLTDMLYGDEWYEELLNREKAYREGKAKTVSLDEFKAQMDNHINETRN